MTGIRHTWNQSEITHKPRNNPNDLQSSLVKLLINNFIPTGKRALGPTRRQITWKLCHVDFWEGRVRWHREVDIWTHLLTQTISCFTPKQLKTQLPLIRSDYPRLCPTAGALVPGWLPTDRPPLLLLPFLLLLGVKWQHKKVLICRELLQ